MKTFLRSVANITLTVFFTWNFINWIGPGNTDLWLTLHFLLFYITFIILIAFNSKFLNKIFKGEETK
jgi:hypothetical protein